MTAIKGSVKSDAWALFQRGEGGAMIVYPVKKGGELAGMVRVTIEAIVVEKPVEWPKRKAILKREVR